MHHSEPRKHTLRYDDRRRRLRSESAPQRYLQKRRDTHIVKLTHRSTYISLATRNTRLSCYKSSKGKVHSMPKASRECRRRKQKWEVSRCEMRQSAPQLRKTPYMLSTARIHTQGERKMLTIRRMHSERAIDYSHGRLAEFIRVAFVVPSATI